MAQKSDVVTVPSHQEMFDRAVRGLASQRFARATNYAEVCLYRKEMSDGSIRHCAWGWVDPDGTADADAIGGNVYDLARAGIGLTALLSEADLLFAWQLQRCHDLARSPDRMQERFRELALQWDLSVPEGFLL